MTGHMINHMTDTHTYTHHAGIVSGLNIHVDGRRWTRGRHGEREDGTLGALETTTTLDW